MTIRASRLHIFKLGLNQFMHMEQHSRPEQLSRFFHALAVSASLLTSSVGLPAFADELSDNTFTSKRVNTLKKSNLIVESFFQQKELTGRVTDADGKGIEGVSVKVKGSAAGTSTDASGQYSLTASNNDKTLVFSNVGYLSQEVAIASNGVTNVTLSADVTSISDVVVIGYGTQKKENLTGAVSTVSSEVLESRPITTLGQGLQGTAPNLNVTQGSGAPGKGSSFNVRGNTSINGGGPLILVNGIPMDVNLISPNDIESVTILKDAASAAIYGARAAYGVILITTKSGKKEKPVVSLSTLFSSNSPTSKIEFIDTKDRIAYMNEASMRVNGRNYYDDITMEAMMAHYNDPTKPSAFIHPARLDEWTGAANTNWEKILMSESYPMQQHTASITGGSDKFDYYSSFSFINQRGLTNRDLFDEYYKRYNVMTNLNYNIKEWISVGTRISINNGNKRFPPNDPYFRNSFPEDGTIYQTNVYSTQPYKDPNGNWTHEGSIFNPAQMLSEGGYQTRLVNDVWMTGLVKIKPIQEISINVDYSFNTKNTKHMSYVAKQPFYNVKGDVVGYYGGSNPNRVTRTDNEDRYYVFNAYADYTKTFLEKHNFKAMVGFNQEYAQYNMVSAERRNLIINSVPYINLASGDRFAYDGIDEYAIRGVFSRINYSYDDRYLVEFNGRYDGTSKFAKKDRFAFFPSVSVGWRIDNEAFFSSLKEKVSLLKIRASYGNLGNQNVPGYYPYIATLSAADVNYLINGDRPMSVIAPGLVSSTLTWETVTQKNIGIDFALLNSRLNGSLDFYTRDTKDMLTKSQTLPAVLAVTEPQANAADLRTRGFDLNITWNDQVGNVSYGLTGILSDYSAKITKYNNPVGLIADYYVGSDIGNIWGLTTGGFFQTDEEALKLDQTNINGRRRQAGDLWMVDLNGDGKITRGAQTLNDHGDMSIIGNNTPRYSYGFRANASWKGIDLDVFFQGVGKRDLQMSQLYYLTQYSNEWVGIPKVAMDYWSPENPNAFFPRPIISGAADVLAVQTRYLQNGAYLRLKQLTIGYTIPQHITQKFSTDRIRVFFTGSNLWTLTKMIKISDPELPGPSSYPMYRSFSFGASISL
ncbi:SusC/RagA family TonB-linked outer membrane protein [Sphingobacterium humi]|uniref:SusC/RagA family TonB-linked outer membrane protein n=2 Tax=Sphingobacterium humi TaxID=1796905 RepID=A0A6N8L3I4_9SPHI|nr:SusC/RagA family TonB-linked outer membrane protein [Sphingobacterium humi]